MTLGNVTVSVRRVLPSVAVAVASMTLAAVIAVAATQFSARADGRARQALATAFWARYDADIAACGRGDVIRTILHDFLNAAEKARREPPLEPGDTKTADAYAELGSRIWPLKKCADLIPAPDVPRPQPPNEREPQ